MLKAEKQTAKKKQAKSARKNANDSGAKKFIFFVSIGFLAVILVYSGVPNRLIAQLTNGSYYSISKDTSKADMQEIIDSLNPDAKTVYTYIDDDGCRKNGVGLAGYQNCKLIGGKYFTASTANAPQVISQLKVQLERHNFKATEQTNSAYNSSLQQILAGQQSGSVYFAASNKSLKYYETPYIILYVELFSHDNSDKIKNHWVQKVIKDKAIPTPPPGDSMFGVRIENTYWNCNNTKLTDVCPSPPSKTKLPT